LLINKNSKIRQKAFFNSSFSLTNLKFHSILWLLIFSIIISLSIVPSAFADSPTVQTFYIPITEEQIRQWSIAVINPIYPIGPDVNNVISITATFNNTVIYYDQWEDGYEYDITNPSQSTTQIWGDSNASNGAPPGCSLDSCDIINAGTVVTLRNNPPPYTPAYTIPANPRDQGNQFFDGRDKFASSQLLVVTRSGWAVPQGTVLAGAAEVFDTRKWGTSYQVPVGINSPAAVAGTMFTYTALSIMAKDDDTVVQVDTNADGTVDLTQTLDQGESILVANISQGATVTSSSAVQVDLMTGQVGSSVAARWFSLIPKADWSDSYYSPVRTTTNGTNSVILYNPGTAAITVNIDTQTGPQAPINIAAGSIARFNLTTSGAHFYTSGDPFYAILTADYNSPSYEWGALLIPELDLTPSVVVGWAPGSDGVPPTNNYSPVWITPVSATTVYLKYDGDTTTGGVGADPFGNRYDVLYNLAALQSQRIYDTSDNDMTGARIWTADATRIAAAWGQDSGNGVGGLPAMDLGTTVLPFPSLTAYKSSFILGDYNNNGGLDPGELLEYTVRVHNAGIIPITDIVLEDFLDPDVTYVADTTTIDGIPLADDSAPKTRFPFDEGGHSIIVSPSLLQPGQDIFVKFQVTVKDPFPPSKLNVLNISKVTSTTGSEVFLNNQITLVLQGKLTTTKTTIIPPGQIIRPGDDITYKIDVTNTSGIPQTGIQLDELVPAGTTYKSGSTTADGPSQKFVKDVFDNLAYNNNDGPSTWKSSWYESDGSQSATAGNVQVINGELRLSTTGDWARRDVDFSRFIVEGFALLRFNYRTNPTFTAGDSVAVQISSNGAGGPWITLQTLTGITGPTSSTLLFNISGYISANTMVRFLVNSMTAGHYFYVDKVEMRAVGGAVGATKTAQDDFSTNDFTGGTGWAGNWIEDDTTGPGPGAGKVRVTGGELRLNGGPDSATGPSAARTVDLSNRALAILNFTFRTGTGVDASDSAVVEISSDGTNFDVLEFFTGITGASSGSRIYDISNYLTANTTVRFRINNGYSGANEFFYVDNVIITAGSQVAVSKYNSAACAPNCLIDGVPSDSVSPDIVVPNDDFALAPGETLTAYFTVTADNPLYKTRIVNTVTSTSYEKSPLSSATVINPVSSGGSIGDLVWLDTIANGVYDFGEPGLFNVRVWLDTNGNSIFDTGIDFETLSGTDGKYIFEGLLPGTYQVFIDGTTVPPGLTLVTSLPPPVTITEDEKFLDNDFGYQTGPTVAVIGDYLWSDASNDGIQDLGEIGIGVVTIDLVSPGPDTLFGTFDDVVVNTTTTNAFGRYYFTNVAPGTYRVEVTDTGGILSGYSPTIGPQSMGDWVGTPVTVTGGKSYMMMDFGFIDPINTFSISDKVWFDSNNNGSFDAGEPGIKEVTVTLLDSSGFVVGAAVSDVNGDFTFTGVPDGDYTIKIEDADGILVGFAPTTPAAEVRELPVTVSGSDISNVSFGFNAPGMIGDTVWNDVNNNGVQDSGELGIEDVLIELYKDTNGDGVFDPAFDQLIDTTTTDSDGNYMFQVSEAGWFFVSIDENQSALLSMVLTTTDDETGPTAPGAQKQVVLLNLNTSFLTADFGYAVLSSDLEVTKVSSATGDVYPGDTITYTITITNTSGTTQTGIQVYDLLPDNTTYVAESTSATGYIIQSPTIVTTQDDFETPFPNQYNGGTGDWTGAWQEIGDDGNPNGGDVRIFSDVGSLRLRIRNPNNGIQRELDLSPYSSATLTFDYRRASFDNPNDYVTIDILTGGTFCQNIVTFAGPVDEAGYTTSPAYPINPACLASNTRSRVLSSPGFGPNDFFYFDNVQIVAQIPGGTTSITKTNVSGDPNQLVDGDPPDLVLPTDSFILEPDDSMTVTFKVLVDNPLDVSVTEILNQVTVSSNETNPVKAYVIDNIAAPPTDLLEKSAPALVAMPLAIQVSGQGTNIITVSSTQNINVGDVIWIVSLAHTVLAINGTQLTLDTSTVPGSDGANIDPVIKFILTYVNNEAYDLTNVTVTDVLSASPQLNYINASPAPFSAPPFNTNGTVIWNLGTVSPNTTGALHLWARPISTGTYLNQGILNSTETGNFPSNQTTTIIGGIELTKITTTPVVINDPSDGLDNATYTITLTPQATQPVFPLEVTDTLPSGFTYNGNLSYGGGNCLNSPSIGDAQPKWDNCNIPIGSSLTITFNALIDPSVPAGTYQNPVTALDKSPSPLTVIPFDELATTAEDVTVELPADLEVVKSVIANDNPCGIGCSITYTITATNVGNSNFTFVNIEDHLPSEVDWVSDTPSQGTYDHTTGEWDAGPIATGSSATLTINATVNTITTITNCASLDVGSSTPNDSFAGNNSDCADIVPTLVTLSDFRSYGENGKVVVQWETASEVGTAGFYLYRLDESTGDYIKINHKLLPAILTSQLGGTYSLIDKGASPGGSYTYVLVEVEARGKKNAYGPFNVQVGEDSAVLTSSSDINPDNLTNCKSKKCAVKQSDAFSSIKSFKKDGTLFVTNTNGNARIQAQMNVGAELFSDYTRKAHEMSDEKKVRIQALKEHRKATAISKSLRKGNLIKISVSDNGLYHLDGSEISALLEIPYEKVTNMIKKNRFTISNLGMSVAYLLAEDNSRIYFYGESIDSIYTKENVYWLYQGSGDQMKTKEGNGPDPAGGTETFTETLHFEKDNHIVPILFNDPKADYWFWDYIVSDNPAYGTRTFTIHADGVADTDTSATATLSVNLHGFTDDTSVNPDHHVVITVINGNNIATVLEPVTEGNDKWDGQSPHTVQYSFSQELLTEGDNTIEVKGLLDTGASESIFYVDSFDLSYHRRYQAVDNRLIARGDGNPVVTIEGFTEPDIFVFDVTDTNKPKVINAITIDEHGTGNYRVSFTPSSPDSLYLAVAMNNGLSTPDLIVAGNASNLKQSNNRADYLVIAPEELKEASQALANYRQSKGLKTMIVELEDIMNEFNYGIYSPEAIKDFLSYAYKKWTKSPGYVVLVGEGTYDYKDNKGFGDNLMPIMVADTPSGLAPSDTLYADAKGNSVPEMAIGRLPVLTPEELQDILNKIIAYEGSTRNNKVIMLADNDDGGGDFHADSDYIAALIPPEYTKVKIYLPEPAQVDFFRQMLIDEMNYGSVLVNYIGHAGVDRLATEGLLRTSDLGLLVNWDSLPVLTAMTCTVGQYAVPGYDSLSEKLVLKNNGGAVAVWAPTGLSLNSLARALDEKFFKAVFESKKAVLGDAILKAFKEYNSEGGSSFMMDIYNLQGDPALKMW
jgi:uncharacterized repeat protein (TIGR01451 family)